MKTLNLISAIMLFSILFNSSSVLLAQNIKITSHQISISQFTTGSQHGQRRSVNYAMNAKKNMIKLGAITDFTSVTGASLQFGHYLCDAKSRMNVYLQYSLKYDRMVPLSNRTTEDIFAFSNNSQNCLFNTLEQYAGFGIQCKLIPHLSLDWNIGCGYYQSNIQGTDTRPTSYPMYRKDSDVSVSLEVSLCFSL